LFLSPPRNTYAALFLFFFAISTSTKLFFFYSVKLHSRHFLQPSSEKKLFKKETAGKTHEEKFLFLFSSSFIWKLKPLLVCDTPNHTHTHTYTHKKTNKQPNAISKTKEVDFQSLVFFPG
jgi:hypothetical protein